MNKKPYVFSAAVLTALLGYYFVYSSKVVDTDSINKVVAYTATYLIGFAIFIGPLTRLAPSLNSLLAYRRPLGLTGFGFAILHVIVLTLHLLGENTAVTAATIVSIVFAGLAFMILTIMSLTSKPEWVSRLTQENWKSLHRLGYLALAFILLHIILLHNGEQLTVITGRVAVVLLAVVLALKAREVLSKTRDL
jgi:DMSO/TMAO reductase YedYZ heme-binding membrane subunit